jgi:hypothetical protein
MCNSVKLKVFLKIDYEKLIHYTHMLKNENDKCKKLKIFFDRLGFDFLVNIIEKREKKLIRKTIISAALTSSSPTTCCKYL